MLEELGLTTYENDAYTTLLELGESDARTISTESGVPFGRIYDILGLLEQKEMLHIQQSRPKKYRPVEPQTAVRQLMNMKKQEFKELQQQAQVIRHELEQLYNPSSKDDLFWKVGIGESLIPSYIEMMQQTQDELLGYVELHPSITVEDINFFFEVIAELIRNDVRIKILVGTSNPSQIEDILDQYQHLIDQIAVRHQEPLTEPFNIIDGNRVILKVRNPVQPEEDFAFIYVWNEEFSEQLRSIYHQLWQDASQF